MTEQYPPIEPFNTGRLQVSDLHNVYFEQVGNPDGEPILFLHGGPGGGIAPFFRRYFDPEHYHIILFDQRGAGKSTPTAELRENTTWDLVADIEQLREHLNIDAWQVFGGSWGSTLALIYAITHPIRVKALTLRGIFLCRPKELQWFYQDGASRIFPDLWEGFLAPIPQDEREDLMTAYYKRLTSDDKAIQLEAAKAWSIWEAGTCKLIYDPKQTKSAGEDEFATAFARIECHYFVNNIFTNSDNYILENIEAIRHIPCEIAQGRYDVVCPAESAWALHRAWPEANLHIVDDAGHASSEKGIASALVSATEKFKAL
jgi:proline iminopeptidase